MKMEAETKGVLLLTLEDYMPDEFEALVEKGMKIAKKHKIKEDEVDKIVHRHRKVEVPDE